MSCNSVWRRLLWQTSSIKFAGFQRSLQVICTVLLYFLPKVTQFKTRRKLSLVMGAIITKNYLVVYRSVRNIVWQ